MVRKLGENSSLYLLTIFYFREIINLRFNVLTKGEFVMYIQHDGKDYKGIRHQHNIMALIGNGFDIAALSKYGKGRMEGKSTTYTEFYQFLSYYNNLYSKENFIFEKMKQDRKNRKENWSDFEKSIDELVYEPSTDFDKLDEYLEEIRNGFTRFLYEIVTTDVLLELNKESRNNNFAITSLSKFLFDLGKNHSKLRFKQNLDHYHLYNFLFVNFNYTMLLDNYIYLDKGCFDPHMFKTVDRNFKFYMDPHKQDDSLSSYVLTNIIHPHGNQYTPRSMLFGTDLPEYDKTKPIKKMIKSFWAQNDVKYRRYFEDTELFIVYGMSLSITDGWWMKKIYDRLAGDKAELIIYYYGTDKSEYEVKQMFLRSCERYNKPASSDEEQQVLDNIYVIGLTHNDNYFLGFKEMID